MAKISDTLKGVTTFFQKKNVQISIIGGILFYLMRTSKLLREVHTKIGISLKGQQVTMFNALFFTSIMWIFITYLLSPFVDAVDKLTDQIERYIPKNEVEESEIEGFKKEDYII